LPQARAACDEGGDPGSGCTVTVTGSRGGLPGSGGGVQGAGQTAGMAFRLIVLHQMIRLRWLRAERDPLRTAEKRLTEGRFKGSSNLDLKADLEVLLRNGGVVPKFDHLAALSEPSSTHYLYGSRYVGADEDALTGAWVAYMLERSMLASKDEFGGNEGLAFCVTSGGICNGPAVDRVTAGLAPPVAEKVRSIYPQLKKALDTADVEAFTPPRR
jgi:hypothetical protein